MFPFGFVLKPVCRKTMFYMSYGGPPVAYVPKGCLTCKISRFVLLCLCSGIVISQNIQKYQMTNFTLPFEMAVLGAYSKLVNIL